MKFLGVVAGLLVSGACGGSGDTDDGVAADLDSRDATSSFAMLRPGHGGRDHGSGPRAVRRAIGAAADRLAALQADTIGDNAHNGVVDADPDDGGWDFILPPTATEHTAAKSPTNLFGNIGLVAWAAVDTGSAGNRALVTALDAGLGMQRDPDIDSAPDFVFGVLLAELADNPGFAEIARQHYDAKRAAFGGATGLGTAIRDGRHARHEDGLIAYDVGWLSISAAALDAAFPGAGYGADAQIYSQIVVDDLTAATPDFDLADPTEDSYVIGLAWSQVAAARVGAVDLFRDVRARLLDQQHDNGAWPTNAMAPGDDIQSTAIAVETIALTDRANRRARQAMRRGVRFLLDGQAANGGWPDAVGNELPLVDGEILLGIMLARTAEGRDGLTPAAMARRAPSAASAPYATPLP